MGGSRTTGEGEQTGDQAARSGPGTGFGAGAKVVVVVVVIVVIVVSPPAVLPPETGTWKGT